MPFPRRRSWRCLKKNIENSEEHSQTRSMSEPTPPPIQVDWDQYSTNLGKRVLGSPRTLWGRDLLLSVELALISLFLVDTPQAAKIISNLAVAGAGVGGAIMGVSIAAAAVASSAFTPEMVVRIARTGRSSIAPLWVYEWVAVVALWTGIVSVAAIVTEPTGNAALVFMALIVFAVTYALGSTFSCLRQTSEAAGLRALAFVIFENEQHGHDGYGGTAPGSRPRPSSMPEWILTIIIIITVAILVYSRAK